MTKTEKHNSGIKAIKPEDIPKDAHWAIIKQGRINVPGDERSKTVFGSEYPEHTKEYITYEAFTNENLFQKAVECLLQTAPDLDFIAIHVNNVATPEVRA